MALVMADDDLPRTRIARALADGIEQSCATCMYCERHRRYCALPELQLPVEPRWSCTLWRI